MEFEQSEIKSVKPGEPILVLNKNANSFEIAEAISFKKDGTYLVTVSHFGKQITVEKWEGR
mgnify:CR=1 FL=1